MADHLHKQIRDKVKTTVTGLTTTGSRVYANRLQQLPDTTSPALRIYTDEEAVAVETVHSPRLESHDLTVVVEGCAKATSALDDTLDLISKEVQVALAGGITIGSINLPVFYTGMRFEDEQLDKPVGVKRMTFSIPYTAMNNAPDVLS